jgi:hypothetical protein
MVHGAPEVVPLTVDLHENLVKMPLPMARSQPLDPALADLVREHQAETMPPEPHSFMAHVDAALVEQVFDIPERKREPHIEHHCQADYLGAGLEVLERGAFCHSRTLVCPLPWLKQSSSDKALSKL